MRGQIIVRTSLVGIVVNILLAAFKAAVGLTANSIAVLLDAVNNLSDALSSVITVAGAKLAGRKPDKEHPFGHGRIEYLSAMIIAAIVFYAGLTSLWESGKKIIEPEAADYSMLSLVIIAVAVVVKIVLGRYFKQQGKAAESGALEASGADALFDAILSFSVLVSALIYLGTGVSLEAYVGVIIAGFIIKSGIDMMRETLNDILGERPDPTLVRKIKGMLAREPEIRGAYDLMMNNYGPGRNYASVHIELPDTMTVEEADRLTRRIHDKVFEATGVRLMGVSVYSYNAKDPGAIPMQGRLQDRHGPSLRPAGPRLLRRPHGERDALRRRRALRQRPPGHPPRTPPRSPGRLSRLPHPHRPRHGHLRHRPRPPRMMK